MTVLWLGLGLLGLVPIYIYDGVMVRVGITVNT